MTPPLVLDGSALSIDDVVTVARSGRGAVVADDAMARLAATRGKLMHAARDGEPHYGINTGFGSFSRKRISDHELAELQVNLVRSHASGVGPPLATEVVRGMVLITAASLARDRSGVRPVIPETLAAMVSAGITPVVPSRGSVGASGDLAPLAHAALVLIGEGEAEVGGQRMPGGDALADAGIEPVALEAKEGLALINGTHLMTSRLALAINDADRLMRSAVAAAAVSLDACRGTDEFLDPRVYEARNHAGPARIAAAMRRLVDGSEIIPSHEDDDPRVQDPYSIRCAPIVLGAALDQIESARTALDSELGAVTDNPLVFPSYLAGDSADIISAGNFHGMPVAIALDTLRVGLTHTAGISERRLYHMISALDEQSGLRPFLSPRPGLHSGYMIVQYAAAALVNEMRTLAAPATVHNVPTCAGMEDFNSFGPTAAEHTARSLELLEQVLACELLCGVQALDAHAPLRTGAQAERVRTIVREWVKTLDRDRPPAPDIEAVASLIRAGEIAACVELE